MNRPEFARNTRGTGAKYGLPWSRAEVVLALALYKTPGVSPSKDDPSVQELAGLIGRTRDAVALKLANLRAIDSNGRSGMSHCAPIDRKVWLEFQGRDDELREEANRLKTDLPQL